MKIKLINEQEFNQIETSRQIIAHEYPRHFAIVPVNGSALTYGINWHSDWLEPMVILAPDGETIWLGMEQKLVAICALKGNILLAFPLTSPLISIVPLDQVTAVLTEAELLIFNRRGSLRYQKSLPELGIEMFVVADNLRINLLDGESWLFNPNTCTLISEQPTNLNSDSKPRIPVNEVMATLS